MYQQTSIHDRAVRVWFTHADGGLIAKGGSLEGFSIAGDDCKFVPATARIDGQTVVVSSPQINSPRFVRYGWENAPAVNLFNAAGLPASPFTSEKYILAPSRP